MHLTDTHTHIYYHEGQDLDRQIQYCLENGVKQLFLPNVDLASMEKIERAVSSYPEVCQAMSGLHPCSVQEDYLEVIDQIQSRTNVQEIVAIGEIGLDLHWDKSTFAYQREAFRIQVEWAGRLGLPIVIHCRNAFAEIFELLEQLRSDRLYGIFHCFTGSLSEAQRAIDMGFLLGIGGVVTFKNSGLDEVVRQLDTAHLVLETDAPYLAPVPFRGKPNQSSYLVHIAQKVADLHQMPVAELAEITSRNAQRVFGSRRQ